MKDLRVVIIRGMPGSGKSTMALKYYVEQKGYVHCEADHYFYNDGEYVFKGSEINEAHAYCRNKAISALEQGKRVVIANTFTRRWEIKELLSQLPVDRSQIEVLHCHGGKGSVHGVSEFIIDKMKKRWEPWDNERKVCLDFTNLRPRVVAYKEEEHADS